MVPVYKLIAAALTAVTLGTTASCQSTTSGGVVGVVITVKEKTVSIRSADAKLEITKTAIAEIIERSGDEKES